MAPQLWDAVRHSVDISNACGLYILTGSVTVDEKSIKHSGIGRISRLRMYTMSLFESNDSNGTVRIMYLTIEIAMDWRQTPLSIYLMADGQQLK